MISVRNFTFVIFTFLKLFFRLIAQILVLNSSNVCHNLIPRIGEIREERRLCRRKNLFML
nr:MAG TPA: hypothetical protein [Caudoviricetes sp.]